MRIIRLLHSCLTIFSPILAFAAPNEPVHDEMAVRQICSETYFHQIDFRECVAKHAQDSQKILRQAEEQMISSLSGWDEDERYIVEARARLAASSQSFIKYRDDQCAFAKSLGGGAIRPALNPLELACVAELNNRRAVQLRDIALDLNTRMEELRRAEESDLPLK